MTILYMPRLITDTNALNRCTDPCKHWLLIHCPWPELSGTGYSPSSWLLCQLIFDQLVRDSHSLPRRVPKAMFIAISESVQCSVSLELFVTTRYAFSLSQGVGHQPKQIYDLYDLYPKTAQDSSYL